jgi:hypothetical protein
LPLLLGSALFTIVFFGGLILLILPDPVFIFWPYFSYHLHARRGQILHPLASSLHSALQTPSRNCADLAAHIFLWPFASLLYLYNAVVAGFSRRIKWRGITYELKSPNEAVIISREP